MVDFLISTVFLNLVINTQHRHDVVSKALRSAKKTACLYRYVLEAVAFRKNQEVQDATPRLELCWAHAILHEMVACD